MPGKTKASKRALLASTTDSDNDDFGNGKRKRTVLRGPSTAAAVMPAKAAPPATAAQVREMEELVLSSVEHANKLVMLHATLQTATAKDVRLAALHALRRIFVEYIMAGRLNQIHAGDGSESEVREATNASDDGNTAAVQARAELCSWLRRRYDLFVAEMLGTRWLAHPTSTSRPVAALRSLFYLIGSDAAATGHSGPFGHVTHRKLIATLLRLPEPSVEVMVVQRDELCNGFADLRLYTMRAISRELRRLCSGRTKDEDEATMIGNAFDLLTMVQMPAVEDELDELEVLARLPEGPDSDGVKRPQVVRLKAHHKAFGDAWLHLLRCPLPAGIFRKVLLCVPTRVIPFLSNPLALCDFLTDSYDRGGVISLLALHGIWVLISEHNLDYPAFYPKLYRLLTAEAVESRYRARFFKLLGLFLSSSHLPAYIVAAFAKRMCRLCIAAPPAVCIYAVPFVFNLLKRHPSIAQMVHRDDAPGHAGSATAVSNGAIADPYDHEASDMSECNAADSSLWELDVLTQHYIPEVASLASVFKTKLGKQLYNIDDFVSHTYSSMLKAELQRKKSRTQDVPTAFTTPMAWLTKGDAWMDALAP